MNQHSKRCGRANGNSVADVRRGATRPAAVVAIVLCVGFAVAMVAIWQFRQPRPHQETQTQPKAAVQTEIPKSEDTEIPTPEAVSPVSVPDDAVPDDAVSPEPSTATPVFQASPAARQLMDDHVNSPANSPTPVQDDQSYDFSYHLNQETITFDAVNPTTQVPGQMTATITGTFRSNRLRDGKSPVGSHLQADQEAIFIFVPYDRYSPSYSAATKRLQAARDTTDDSILFDFGLTTTGSDGSSQEFTLREVVTVTEDGAQVTFEQLK